METKPWYQSWQLWTGLILFVLAVVDFKFIQMLGKELDVTIALSGLGLIGFRIKTNTGIEGVRLLVFVLLPTLLFVGCGAHTTAVKEVFVSGLEKGFPVVNIIHAEEIKHGLDLQLGPEGSTLIGLSLGRTDRFFNWTIAPLGADSFIWQHNNALDAVSVPVQAGISGQTIIRIDQPAYLGPLIH